MSAVTVRDGSTIYYKDWGPRNAQPIVFHHGWPLYFDQIVPIADSALLSAKRLGKG